jgi:hypothetical protein
MSRYAWRRHQQAARSRPDEGERAIRTTNVGRILDDFGATLLDFVHGDVGVLNAPIGGVAIHDPLDEPSLPPRAVVLGVTVSGADEIAGLLHALGEARAAALVLRAPVPSDDVIAAAAREAGVAVLALTRGTSWAQITTRLRALTAVTDMSSSASGALDGSPSSDLFALANAVAALLDAPITIEDRNSRVLAFSGRQDEADVDRVQTILGREVPERNRRVFVERGVFGKLYREDCPVWIDPVSFDPDAESLPRVAMAVRIGDEVLGSIWVAVREPLSGEREQALRDAAKVVALHLFRERAGADVERRLRADLVRTAMEGGPAARGAADQLGLAHDAVCVLALGVLGAGDEVGTDAVAARERQRLADALALHVSAAHPRATAAVVGRVIYGLIPGPGGGADDDERIVRISEEFLDRVGDRVHAAIGVSPVVPAPEELAVARASADRALRVLRSARADKRVARLDDVQGDALLLDLQDLATARHEDTSGPVSRLLAHDAEHGTHLAATLSAWLETFGDVVAAAQRLDVHPNTFRHRLRRVAQIGGVDLNDPDARFAAMLQLRVLPARTSLADHP